MKKRKKIKTLKDNEPNKIILNLNKASDIYIYSQGIVWAKDDTGLTYSIPHFSYGKTLLKLPNPPETLIIYSTGKIIKYEILEFNPDRR